ncbi:DUF4186 family protein [Streptomyces sp. NPDC001970]
MISRAQNGDNRRLWPRRLRSRDRAVVDLRGRHTEELVERRPAPTEPRNDGRQTPYRGHPEFDAQHATATCCRTCLERWHGIPAGRALDDAEQGIRDLEGGQPTRVLLAKLVTDAMADIPDDLPPDFA